MISYATAFVVSLSTAMLLTPLVRHLSNKLGLAETPGDRHVHVRAIPRTGGIAIVLAFLTPVLGIALTRANVGQAVVRNPEFVLGITGGGLLIMGIGLLDDLKGLGAKKKALLQVLVATLAFFLGFQIQAVRLPLGGILPMGVFSYLITVLWIVGIINAVNLIDGLDGLAGGIAFFVLILNFVIGYGNRSILACLVAAALAGAILGFLVYNFNPASIFMGDAGSMFIGYVLALGAINSGQKTSTTVALLTPIVALGIPIMDTLFSMVRRFLERRPMFSPDRGHIHHRLLAMGLTHRRAVVMLYIFTAALVGVALLLHTGHNWQIGVGLALMVATFVVFARIVGIAEYFTKKRRRRLGVRTARAEKLRTVIFDALQRAESVGSLALMEECIEWFRVAGAFSFVELTLTGHTSPALVASDSDDPDDGRLPVLHVSIPVFDSSKTESAVLRFGWRSERGRVSGETHILLQIFADRLAAKLDQFYPASSRKAQPEAE